jgi:hypothetical protein
MSGITDTLKLGTAAKAYLGGAAVAAQVALSYMPDHSSPYYTGCQGLLAVLGVIGIFAVPNKVTEAKQATDEALAAGQEIVKTVIQYVPSTKAGGPALEARVAEKAAPVEIPAAAADVAEGAAPHELPAPGVPSAPDPAAQETPATPEAPEAPEAPATPVTGA